jgi:hypothetical protein
MRIPLTDSPDSTSVLVEVDARELPQDQQLAASRSGTH